MKNKYTYLMAVFIFFTMNHAVEHNDPSQPSIQSSDAIPLFNINTHTTLHYLRALLKYKPTCLDRNSTEFKTFLAQFLFEECGLHNASAQSVNDTIDVLKQRTRVCPNEITYDELLCANAVIVVQKILGIPSNTKMLIQQNIHQASEDFHKTNMMIEEMYNAWKKYAVQ